jgi:hypothetical protein
MPTQPPPRISVARAFRRALSLFAQRFAPPDRASLTIARRRVGGAVATLVIVVLSCSSPDSAEQEAVRVRDALTPHSQDAPTPPLVARIEPMEKEFSWTFQVAGDWRGYASSLDRRLPDYTFAGSGESWREFVRLLPGDEYQLRIERLDNLNGPAAVVRFRALPR